MDLAAKGWISRPTPPSLPRPRAVPQFPHLPDGGKMPISCLMHFELIPPPHPGKSRRHPKAGEPTLAGATQPAHPPEPPQPVCSTHLGTRLVRIWGRFSFFGVVFGFGVVFCFGFFLSSWLVVSDLK